MHLDFASSIAACTLAPSKAAPALACNPQPDPPGR